MASTNRSDLTIEVIEPKNFRKKLNHSEIRELFVPFLESVGLRGKFTLRCECLKKGSVGKAWSIRFQWRPISSTSGLAVIHVNFQLATQDLNLDAVLSAGPGRAARDVYLKLAAGPHHQAGCFVLSTYKSSLTSEGPSSSDPNILWTDIPLYEKAMGQICDVAAADPNTFATRGAIDTIICRTFPPEIEWGAHGPSGHLERAGMISSFDDDDPENLNARMFVEECTFEAVDRIHPDKVRANGADPDSGDVIVTPPEKPKSVMAQFLEAKKAAAATIAKHDQAVKERSAVTNGIELAEKDLIEVTSQIAELQRRAEEKRRFIQSLKDKQAAQVKALADPEYEEAREFMEAFAVK